MCSSFDSCMSLLVICSQLFQYCLIELHYWRWCNALKSLFKHFTREFLLKVFIMCCTQYLCPTSSNSSSNTLSRPYKCGSILIAWKNMIWKYIQYQQSTRILTFCWYKTKMYSLLFEVFLDHQSIKSKPMPLLSNLLSMSFTKY